MVDQALLENKVRLIMELRSLGIHDTNVLSAIETVPRELFLPEALKKHAYDNVSLPISLGQTISQPYVVARMTEALEMSGRQRVLEIGTGSGYQAAVLSCLSRRVYTIERLRPLLVEAERRLGLLNVTNLTSKYGDGALGWPEAAPFDRILLTCAAAERPGILIDQLKPGGILVAPVDNEASNSIKGDSIKGDGNKKEQVIRRYRVDDKGRVSEEDLLPVRFVPLITDVDIDPSSNTR